MWTLSEAEAATARTVLTEQLFWFDHPHGPVRFCSGFSRRVWAGNTYTPVGFLANVSDLEFEENAVVSVLTAQLDALSSFVAEEIEVDISGRRVELYEGVIGDDGSWAIAPKLLWRGVANFCAIENTVYVLNAISPALAAGFDSIPRMSYNWQLARFPGDVGLNRLAVLNQQELIWKKRS